MIQKRFFQKLLLLGVAAGFMTMCVPPEQSEADADTAEVARLDSIRKVRCPRVFSSAAEFYKNRDWEATVRAYDELTDLGCDREEPQEVYLYYAIAYEYMGKYDSSEIVLLKGLTYLPDNIDLTAGFSTRSKVTSACSPGSKLARIRSYSLSAQA